jgi:hypothetical protein
LQAIAAIFTAKKYLNMTNEGGAIEKENSFD